jgi:hypothetical protein
MSREYGGHSDDDGLVTGFNVPAVAASVLPEPSTPALFGFGLLGLAGMRVLRAKPVAT